MKITNYSRDEEVVEFDIQGVDSGTLNAFRRTIISGVPVMAVDLVTFYNNSSILNDENLGHRIGLMPLTNDAKTYVPRSQCKCKGEGCARCMCTLSVDAVGPKTVYSGDFKSTDDKVKPVYDTVPLVKLMADQKLKAEAQAYMDYGSSHVKWQPGLASFELKDDGSYHVMVESYGPMPVDELIKKAFEVVEEKIGELKKKVK